MNNLINLINDKLDKYLQIEIPESLFESMKYTVTLPGKRLRPILCLETCRLLGGDIENAMASACALEMLHAQTLIHDDLPCMDNDDFRRGQPSNHKVYGEAIAVLAGDALLTYAPEIIVKYSKNLDCETILRILKEYFNYAGARGVIAGQVVDIESEQKENIENKIETLEYIHLHKTADLFKLSMRLGGIIAGANEKQLDVITEFAQNFGIAFQICDDILDETSTFDELGKTIGKDKQEGKLTYVSLYGLEKAKCKLTCLLDSCYDIITKHNIESNIISSIIEKMKQRAGI